MSLRDRLSGKPTATAGPTAPTAPAQPAPGIRSLVKTAGVSLTKHGLGDARAAVYLVLDHSGSMRPHYATGAVQRITEQALGLAVNLDDDGTVPVIAFSSCAEPPVQVSLGNFPGAADRISRTARWGSTDYVAAMEAVVTHHTMTAAPGTPALVVFQTDGEPDQPDMTAFLLRNLSTAPVFWAFVGFGDRVRFLERLDTLDSRLVDNASFFHAADPFQVSDAELYDGITGQYAAWLRDARAARIVR
ncbi:VWA domain-containing protein [Kitasatospora sp. NPDC097605]|uniref:VWA domain-containing protein n=1 Tax=Kitasatospora sp. NPDC097605 TaxID=3157226 RepID=UPI00331AF14E